MDRDQSFCDTELSLRFGGITDASTSFAGNGTAETSLRPQKFDQQQKHLKQSQQQMTLVYGDRVFVCDVTDIQARAIISMAQRREMGKSMKLSSSGGMFQEEPSPSPTPPSTPHGDFMQQPQIRISGLSMKRSLQRFLEKRKTRVIEASPYNVINKQACKC